MSAWIWAAAAVLYLIFLAWYVNWSGPVKADEIDGYIAALVSGDGAETIDAEIIRSFLKEDDGEEFIMQNFVKFPDGNITHPRTGEPAKPLEVVQEYFVPFSKALLARGGHPVFTARKVGGYIDSWKYDPDPGWHATAMMRYKSRRDLVELAADPRFADMHVFKTSAIEQTISFPVQLNISFFLGPKFFVPLILLLLASLGQHVLFLFK